MHKLKGESVLVAGGAGFIGSQIVRELVELGAKVAVYDNLMHGRLSHLDEVKDDITVFVGDAVDEWKLARTFREFRPAYAFNLVGDTYVPTAYDVPKRFFRINLEGNLNILMACKLYEVKRVLYVSSTEVYGEAVTVPMAEDHILHPLNTYAVSKLAADRLCFTFHHEHGIPVVIARIFNSYGPRITEPYVISEIISQLDKGPVVELGNLRAKRDFTYVSDTARGLIAALCSDLPDGEPVNVGSGDVYSVEELAHMIGKVMGYERIDIHIDERRLRQFDINLFQCDNTRLCEATGWKPEVSIEEGLQRTVAWFRSHGHRWCWEEKFSPETLYAP